MAVEEKTSATDFRIKLSFALRQVPIRALNEQIRKLLEEGLNKITVKTAANGMNRNFRGLAELIGFKHPELSSISHSDNPTSELLHFWESQRGNNIGRLLECLNKLERYDLLDDLKPILERISLDFMPYISSPEESSPEEQVRASRAREYGLDYVTRSEWGAYRTHLSVLSVNPIRLIFIHNSVFYDSDAALCLRRMQAYKIIHYAHSDLPYNFLVCENGRVYEGRGWHSAGSHTLKYNYVSISIGMVGNYEVHPVKSAMIDTAAKLIEYGVHSGFIDCDYGIYPHCDASITCSPGKHTVEAISRWPRFRAFGPLPSAKSFLPTDMENEPANK